MSVLYINNSIRNNTCSQRCLLVFNNNTTHRTSAVTIHTRTGKFVFLQCAKFGQNLPSRFRNLLFQFQYVVGFDLGSERWQTTLFKLSLQKSSLQDLHVSRGHALKVHIHVLKGQAFQIITHTKKSSIQSIQGTHVRSVKH